MGEDEEPICAFCGRAIGPKDPRVRMQSAIYHSRCWERKSRGQRPG